MSLFDTIRYPVSKDMPHKEFMKIPAEIRFAWIQHPDFVPTDPDKRPLKEGNNCELLQRIILEWEDD